MKPTTDFLSRLKAADAVVRKTPLAPDLDRRVQRALTRQAQELPKPVASSALEDRTLGDGRLGDGRLGDGRRTTKIKGWAQRWQLFLVPVAAVAAAVVFWPSPAPAPTPTLVVANAAAGFDIPKSCSFQVLPNGIKFLKPCQLQVRDLRVQIEARAGSRLRRETNDLRVLAGAAHFSVKKRLPSEPSFRVLAEDAVIEVLGTQFFVQLAPSPGWVSLKEGSIRLWRRSLPAVVMVPGDRMPLRLLAPEPAAALPPGSKVKQGGIQAREQTRPPSTALRSETGHRETLFGESTAAASLAAPDANPPQRVAASKGEKGREHSVAHLAGVRLGAATAVPIPATPITVAKALTRPAVTRPAATRLAITADDATAALRAIAELRAAEEYQVALANLRALLAHQLPGRIHRLALQEQISLIRKTRQPDQERCGPLAELIKITRDPVSLSYLQQQSQALSCPGREP